MMKDTMDKPEAAEEINIYLRVFKAIKEPVATTRKLQMNVIKNQGKFYQGDFYMSKCFPVYV